MEYFLQFFGDKNISWAVAAIGTLVFIAVCAKKVNEYFSEKVIRENENNERMEKVISQAEQYPIWHQQSIDMQNKYNEVFVEIHNKLDKIDERITGLEDDTKEESVTNRRYRVLRFDDEIRHKQDHTKEHFNQILDDITKYELYCSMHPNYKNNQAEMAIANIKETYHDCVQNDSFL